MKLAISAIAVCLAAAAPAGFAATIFNTVLHTGDAAPGIAGATISDVNSPVINNAGQVAFRAVTSTGLEVIYFGDPNVLTPVAREGDPAFGGPATFGGFDARLVLTDDGHIIFQGDLTGTGITSANNRFIAVAPPVFAGVAGTPLKIAQESDPVPNSPLTFRPDAFALGASGPQVLAASGPHAAFRATANDSTAPGTVREGIFAFDLTNGLVPIVVSGEAAPDGLGTFLLPPGFFGNVFEPAGLGPDGFLTFEAIGSDGTTPFNGIFDYYPPPDPAVPAGSPISTRVLAGDKSPGTKPKRGFADFSGIGIAEGGRLIFQSILQNTTTLEVLFDEIGLFTDLGPDGPVQRLALRDKTAPGAGQGVVYSGFFAAALNEDGAALLEAALFKKPNGLTPPKDMGLFIGEAPKARVVLNGGDALVEEDGTSNSLSDINAYGSFALRSGDLRAVAILMAALVERDPSPGPARTGVVVAELNGTKRANTVVAIEGKPIDTTTGTRTVTTITVPTTPMGSAGQPRIGNAQGEIALEIEDNGGAGIYVDDADGATAPKLQPDIYLGNAKKIGDGVHQNKPADPQIQSREVMNNTEDTIIFFVQNDGNATDTINFTSSGKDSGGRIRWFAGDDQSVEITDDVLGTGKAFTLKPGETQKLRLVVKNVDLTGKSRADKVKMKAISTVDPKKPRDTYQFTVKFHP